MRLLRIKNNHPFYFKIVYNNSHEYHQYEYYTLQIYFLKRYVFDMVYWIRRKKEKSNNV